MNSELEDLRGKVKSLELQVEILKNQLTQALNHLSGESRDPESTAVKSRVILERLVKDIYKRKEIPLPKRIELGPLLNNNQFTRLLPDLIVTRMHTIRVFGNVGGHDKSEPISEFDAMDSIRFLVSIVDWYCKEFLKKGVSQTKNPREVSARRVEAGAGSHEISKTNTTKLAMIAITLALIVGGYFATGSNKPSERNFLVTGIDKNILSVLQIAYDKELNEPAPSGTVTFFAKYANDSSAIWHSLKNGQSLSSADSFKVMFNLIEPAFVYIFGVDSSGKLSWLFPKNKATEFSEGKNPVPEGLWTTLPDETQAFFLDDNLGMEHFYLVATRSRWDEFEKYLEKAALEQGKRSSVTTAFNFKTRGIKGVRPSKVLLPDELKNSSHDIVEFIKGDKGVLVIEKWLQHVSEAK